MKHFIALTPFDTRVVIIRILVSQSACLCVNIDNNNTLESFPYRGLRFVRFVGSEELGNLNKLKISIVQQ
jgi:hypothetical protein